MTRRATLTDVAYESLRHVLREHSAGRWARARRKGERPSLAALHARGLVVRQAWRGVEGEADAAYEYKLSKAGIEHLQAHLALLLGRDALLAERGARGDLAVS